MRDDIQVRWKARRGKIERPRSDIFVLKYRNQTSIMAVKGQSTSFVRISGGAENEIMHSIDYHLNKKPN